MPASRPLSSAAEPLLRVRPDNISVARGFRPGALPTLKRHEYAVQTGYSITGDAPKQFLRVHEPPPKTHRRTQGSIPHKANRHTWPLYIAKTARKWYPTESILEFVLNQLGEAWGLCMAPSRLVWAGGQVRFLSRYFLNKPYHELVHGADILADYMNDRDFVQAIEAEDKEREMNSVQLMVRALRGVFGPDAPPLVADFGTLLLFDALVGNNDRHFYNYGVVRDLTGHRKPYFSPVYDTARALLWNVPEATVQRLHRDPAYAKTFFARYLKKSQPKLGWDGHANINHFGLVQELATSELCLPRAKVHSFFSLEKLQRCLRLLETDFSGLLSPERITLMQRCLQARFDHLTQLLCSLP